MDTGLISSYTFNLQVIVLLFDGSIAATVTTTVTITIDTNKLGKQREQLKQQKHVVKLPVLPSTATATAAVALDTTPGTAAFACTWCQRRQGEVKLALLPAAVADSATAFAADVITVAAFAYV